MPKTALVVVDVQKFFIEPAIANLPAKIKDWVKKAKYDEIVFTKFINTINSNFYAHGWDKCMDSPDTDIHPDLATLSAEMPVFEKSGFSAFRAEGLMDYLKRKNITDVHLCGTDTDACVLASAYDAFELGFKVKVLEELCASRNGSDYHEMGLNIMRRNLGFMDTNKKQ